MSDQALTVIETTAVSSASTFLPVMDMKQAMARREAILQFAKKVMRDGEDFGTIPGSKKPCLYKAGAEKLANFFGLEPEFCLLEKIEDWTGEQHGGEPLFYARYQCSIYRDGKRLGMGEGSCNTWESKYRYRWVAEDQVPLGINKESLMQQDGTRQHTEFDFAVDKAETGGQYGKPAEYWDAFKEAIRNGTAKPGDKEIKSGKTAGQKKKTWTISIGARLFRCPNPETYDLCNTILKMSQKRAFIAAMLIATGASQFFTQDLGDKEPLEDDDEMSQADMAVAQFRAADKFKKLEAFQQLKKSLNASTGDDKYYYKLLHEEANGAKKSTEIKTLADAVKAFKKMWMEVDRLSNPADVDDENVAF